MKIYKGEIKNWGIIYWPQFKAYVVVGELNDALIRTSSIELFHGDVVETQNSIYSLQGPSDHEAAQAAFTASLKL